MVRLSIKKIIYFSIVVLTLLPLVNMFHNINLLNLGKDNISEMVSYTEILQHQHLLAVYGDA